MNKRNVFLIAGGDLRQIYAAKSLTGKYTVYAVGFDSAVKDTENIHLINSLKDMPEKADCVILPLPVSDDNVNIYTPFSEKKIPVESVKSVLKNNTVITGGRIADNIRGILSDIYDYSEREEFCVLNAIPTAEAAIETVLQNTDSVLYNSKILITGFGRISKVLAKILIGFGADVTAAARKKSDLSWAEIAGCHAVEIKDINRLAGEFDFIFNTAPAMILDSCFLKNTKHNVCITDLASRPGGTDFEYAKSHNIRAFHALALPGKFFPVTAGKIIALTAENIFKERSVPE